MRELRREMQIVFQDPYASLDPRMTVGASIERAAEDPEDRRATTSDRVAELLELVGPRPGARAAASRTSSPAVSASGSASPGRWRSTRR